MAVLASYLELDGQTNGLISIVAGGRKHGSLSLSVNHLHRLAQTTARNLLGSAWPRQSMLRVCMADTEKDETKKTLKTVR